MKSKFKVLFMPGTHAATCDRVVIFCIQHLFLLNIFFSVLTLNLIKIKFLTGLAIQILAWGGHMGGGIGA